MTPEVQICVGLFIALYGLFSLWYGHICFKVGVFKGAYLAKYPEDQERPLYQDAAKVMRGTAFEDMLVVEVEDDD